jgi:hypothetical protein
MLATLGDQPFEHRLARKDGVGERHAAPRRGRRRFIVQSNGMAGAEQHDRNGRADIPAPAYQHRLLRH